MSIMIVGHAASGASTCLAVRTSLLFDGAGLTQMGLAKLAENNYNVRKGNHLMLCLNTN